MVTAESSSPDSCAYCGVSVDGETAYRRHLHDVHDPSELGAIDRRRYESFRADPNVLVRGLLAVVAALGDLRYPVDAETAVRYAAYGFASSVFLAALLGVVL